MDRRQLELAVEAKRRGLSMPAKEKPAETNPAFFAEGFNRQAATILGAPVDLIAKGLRAVGVDVPENAAGGSQSLQDILSGAGVMSPQARPDTPAERVMMRAGEDVATGMAMAAPVMGVAGSAARAAGQAAPIAGAAVREAATAPGKFAAGELVASVGSGVGAGVANEVAPGSVVAEMAGSLGGSMAAGLAKEGARTALRGGEAGRQAMQDSIDNFAAGGATPTVAQATESGGLSALENTLSRLPGGVSVYARQGQRTADAIGKRIDKLAGNVRATTGADVAGRSIQGGISKFVSRFKQSGGALFNKVDEFIDPATTVRPENYAQKLDELASGVAGAQSQSRVLSPSRIGELKRAFEADAPDGQMTYEAMKSIRTRIGDRLSDVGLVADESRAQLKQLYAALTEDMAAAAKEAGPEAEKALRRANSYWSAGMDRIEGVLTKIARKGTPEDAYRAVTGGTDASTTIRAMRRSLEPEEWDAVVATTLRRLGKATNSAQDDLGEVFSAETFLTNWNKMTPQAKSALLGGTRYRSLSDSMDKIAAAASSIRDSSKALANPSGTGQATASIASAAMAAMAILSGNTTAAGLLAGQAGLANAASRLMTSPRFVRWLAKETDESARAAGALGRLATAMERETDPEVLEAAQSFAGAFSQAQRGQQPTSP